MEAGFLPALDEDQVDSDIHLVGVADQVDIHHVGVVKLHLYRHAQDHRLP